MAPFVDFTSVKTRARALGNSSSANGRVVELELDPRDAAELQVTGSARLRMFTQAGQYESMMSA